MVQEATWKMGGPPAGCCLVASAFLAAALMGCSSADTKSDRGGATAGGGTPVGTGAMADTGTGGDNSGGLASTGGVGPGLGSGGLLGTGAVPGSGGTDGSGGSTMPEDGGVCGMGTTMAERSPVNMLVMFDRSTSMELNNKWADATAALGSFFGNPGSAGLRVALRFFPHNTPAVGCAMDACDSAACSEPLVPLAELTVDAAPTDAQEGALADAILASVPTRLGTNGSGTPISAALDGALIWAAQNRMDYPTEDTVVIFVTDGEPHGCDESPANIAALASSALAASNVKTYAIGLEGSNTAQMDMLAMAGGTGQGIYIGSGANAQQQLLDELNAIRSETLSCSIKMPEPTDPSTPVDPSKVNVTFTNGAGTAFTVAQAADEPACAGSASWYYDDPANPTQIVLCPAACDIVRGDTAGRLEILLGCPTVCGGLDVNCGGDDIPPEVPPLLE